MAVLKYFSSIGEAPGEGRLVMKARSCPSGNELELPV